VVLPIRSGAPGNARHAERAAGLAGQHADHKLGIADAHTMILAARDRYATTRVLTFDQKHFRR
jgi:predicted nucleic acid-binding protein